MNKPLAFRKVGTAYRVQVQDGYFWLKRNTSNRWQLVWEHRDNYGERAWGVLGTYTNLAAAKQDAAALDAN
jgi:hypothetical protein